MLRNLGELGCKEESEPATGGGDASIAEESVQEGECSRNSAKAAMSSSKE